MYHGVVKTPLKVFDWCFVQESAFEAQLEYLRTRFDIVPLSRIPALLREGIRRPTAAITFDDGFLNNYDVAFPILCRARVPVTIFICTDLIDTADTLWFCRLNWALAETRMTSLKWDGKHFDLAGVEKRAISSARLQAELKQGTPAELSNNVDEIILRLGAYCKPLEISSPYRMLTCAAIRAMERSQLVEFGAHTKNHSILKRLSAAERRVQIEGSISAVQTLIEQSCRLFAYPNGQRGDYDQECLDLLRAAGISAAVTAIPGVNDLRTPPLELRRIGVGGDLGLDSFKALVADAEGSREPWQAESTDAPAGRLP